jgi:hypothetical protein
VPSAHRLQSIQVQFFSDIGPKPVVQFMSRCPQGKRFAWPLAIETAQNRNLLFL